MNYRRKSSITKPKKYTISSKYPGKTINYSPGICKSACMKITYHAGIVFLNFISLASDNWSTILFPEEQMDTLTGVTVSF